MFGSKWFHEIVLPISKKATRSRIRAQQALQSHMTGIITGRKAAFKLFCIRLMRATFPRGQHFNGLLELLATASAKLLLLLSRACQAAHLILRFKLRNPNMQPGR